MIAQKNVQDMMNCMPTFAELKRELQRELQDGSSKKFMDLAGPYIDLMTTESDQ